MATQPNMGSLPAFPITVPMPAVTRILARFERDQLAGFIAVAIELLDTLDPDPEDEDNADREASDGDDRDQANVEWTSMRGAAKRGPNIFAGEEDDEDDDPDTGVEDGSRGFDPESDYGGDEAGESEQMACYFIGDHRPA